MPQYEIERYELHTVKYIVEASSEAAAIVKLIDGVLCQPVDNSLEFIEVADDYGMPTEEYRELADAISRITDGIVTDSHITSIRSIEEVD